MPVIINPAVADSAKCFQLMAGIMSLLLTCLFPAVMGTVYTVICLQMILNASCPDSGIRMASQEVGIGVVCAFFTAHSFPQFNNITGVEARRCNDINTFQVAIRFIFFAKRGGDNIRYAGEQAASLIAQIFNSGLLYL